MLQKRPRTVRDRKDEKVYKMVRGAKRITHLGDAGESVGSIPEDGWSS